MTDRQVFEQLYHSHHDKVYRLCLGYMKGNSALAKDATQDAFLALYQNFEKFRAESELSTYLYRIAVNTCLLKKRTDKKYRLDHEPSSVDNTQSEEETPEDPLPKLREMWRCIDNLETEKQSMVLLELEGIPQKQIAKILDRSHASVRTALHRIKNQLLNCMTHE